jgi:ATP-dependent RNA helicase DDX27
MEVKKGQNILEHEAEIYSKPARTWFQTGRDKQQSKSTSLVTFALYTYDRPA